MQEIAPDVFQIPLMPRNGINAFLLGDVLVDAGLASSAKKIVKALAGRTVATLTFTHAHVDHAGGARRLVDQLEPDVWAPAGDAGDIRSGEPAVPDHRARKLMEFAGGFDGVDVTRELQEGDTVGPGFVVVNLPGHSPGQVGYWRASDRVLITGDVFMNMNPLTTVVGLHLPPNLVTVDPVRNRVSARQAAALEPAVVGFGHGPVLREAAPKLAAFVASVPQ